MSLVFSGGSVGEGLGINWKSFLSLICLDRYKHVGIVFVSVGKSCVGKFDQLVKMFNQLGLHEVSLG